MTFRNIHIDGNRFNVVTVDESRGVTLEALGFVGREYSGSAAMLTWGERKIRFEYDGSNDTDPATDRGFAWWFFLRMGVGEQYLKHADVSTWPWDAGRVADDDREQARLLAIEAILMRQTHHVQRHPVWLGTWRFRSGGREFTLEDFGYDAAMVQEANKR